MLACVFVVVAVVVVVALECMRPAWACLHVPLKTPSGLLVRTFATYSADTYDGEQFVSRCELS